MGKPLIAKNKPFVQSDVLRALDESPYVRLVIPGLAGPPKDTPVELLFLFNGPIFKIDLEHNRIRERSRKGRTVKQTLMRMGNGMVLRTALFRDLIKEGVFPKGKPDQMRNGVRYQSRLSTEKLILIWVHYWVNKLTGDTK